MDRSLPRIVLAVPERDGDVGAEALGSISGWPRAASSGESAGPRIPPWDRPSDGQPMTGLNPAGTRRPPRICPSTGLDGQQGPTCPSGLSHDRLSIGRRQLAAREPHWCTGRVSESLGHSTAEIPT